MGRGSAGVCERPNWRKAQNTSTTLHPRHATHLYSARPHASLQSRCLCCLRCHACARTPRHHRPGPAGLSACSGGDGGRSTLLLPPSRLVRLPPRSKLLSLALPLPLFSCLLAAWGGRLGGRPRPWTGRCQRCLLPGTVRPTQLRVGSTSSRGWRRGRVIMLLGQPGEGSGQGPV